MSEELLTVLAEMFDAESDELNEETTFDELCADEYDFEEISFNIEEIYGFTPDVKKLKKLKTLGDLDTYIKENAQ